LLKHIIGEGHPCDAAVRPRRKRLFARPGAAAPAHSTFM
jgi:hypothetical protein